MEHDSSRSGYHEPEPGLAGLEDEEDWGDDFPKTFSDRKSTRLNSSHSAKSRMPSSA